MAKLNKDGLKPGQAVTWEQMVAANAARAHEPEPSVKSTTKTDPKAKANAD